MEAKQLYEFDKDLTNGIPIRQMIGTFDIYKLRWNKKRNEENANRKMRPFFLFSILCFEIS